MMTTTATAIVEAVTPALLAAPAAWTMIGVPQRLAHTNRNSLILRLVIVLASVY